MRSAVVLGVWGGLCTLGCGARVDGGELLGQQDGNAADARSSDGLPIDAAIDAPPDARACLEGDARMQVGEACFMVFATPQLWADADAVCATVGARLATVLSAAEDTALAQLRAGLALSDLWLGGNDQAVEMDWRWVADNSSLTYIDWRAGEPNNGGLGGTPENCMILEVGSDLWDDRPCTLAYAFACRR